MPHPARVLERADVHRLLVAVRQHRHALRDRALVLLSFKTGLCACEMSGLDWSMVLTPKGGIADQLYIAASIAKNAAARRVPVHPDLAYALLARTGGSLRDVQELEGHRRLTTTERYIEGDRAAQHRLIRLV